MIIQLSQYLPMLIGLGRQIIDLLVTDKSHAISLLLNFE